LPVNEQDVGENELVGSHHLTSTLDDEDRPLLVIDGHDFVAPGRRGDISISIDPIRSPPDRFGSDAPFRFPGPAIILNASAKVTPMHRNDRRERPLSKYRNSNGGRYALAVGERE
jgi:hypothetical protein